jgi:hypothetical protein
MKLDNCFRIFSTPIILLCLLGSCKLTTINTQQQNTQKNTSESSVQINNNHSLETKGNISGGGDSIQHTQSHAPSSTMVSITPTAFLNDYETPLEYLLNVLEITNNLPIDYNPNNLKKLDSNLQLLIADYFVDINSLNLAVNRGIQVDSQGAILIDIYLNEEPNNVMDLLNEKNMEVESISDTYLLIEGWMPIINIIEITQMNEVKGILPVIDNVTD